MRYFLRHITHMSLPVALALLVGILGLWSVDYIRQSEQWGLILLANRHQFKAITFDGHPMCRGKETGARLAGF